MEVRASPRFAGQRSQRAVSGRAATLDVVSEPTGPEREDDEVLPEQTSDDTDRGWGEGADADADADDIERLTREKPPHW